MGALPVYQPVDARFTEKNSCDLPRSFKEINTNTIEEAVPEMYAATTSPEVSLVVWNGASANTTFTALSNPLDRQNKRSKTS